MLQCVERETCIVAQKIWYYLLQTKFVAIILVLSAFFNASPRLADFSSDAFDFSFS